MSASKRLSRLEIHAVQHGYIGVKDGYLGDFSYQSHRDFYPAYCDLDVNPDDYPGTTRARFERILNEAHPAHQARILRGVLKRFPPENHPTRAGLSERLLGWIARLEGVGTPSVQPPTLQVTSDVVLRALQDAESLLRTSGATSGVDRIHTALHGYLLAVCDGANVTHGKDASIPALLKALREQHPAFRPSGPRASDVTQILRALATIVDVLGPMRNMASVAHPNAALLDVAEAVLVFNTVRTVLQYLDAKLA